MRFLKIEEEGAVCWSQRAKKERQLVELAGDQSPSLEGPPRSKEDVKREATIRKAIEKSWRVRVIDRKEVRGEDPIEYFLSTE